MRSDWIMRFSWISFIILLDIFGFSLLANAEVIHEFKKPMVGFQNHAKPTETYFFSKDPWAETKEGTQAYWAIVFDGISERKIKSPINYEILNPLCIPESQDTMSMSAAGGMTLAHPYLVGVKQICYIDDLKHTIDLVSEIRAMLPAQHFSVSYAGSDDTESFFMVNSFPPNKKSGVLSLVRINRSEKSVLVLPEWISEVPGLSGAMHPSLGTKGEIKEGIDEGTEPLIWYTAALADRTNRGNIIFKMHPKQLLKYKTSTLKSVPFSTQGLTTQMSPSVAQPFSFFMISNEISLLYYNDEYGSYIVDQKTMQAQEATLPDGCIPVRGFKKKWLLLCNEKTVLLWDATENK